MPSTQQGTPSPTAKDTRRPWARLMEYRLDIADWDAARMVRCDNAWLELDEAPVLLRAQAPPEDEKEKAEAQKKKTSPPPEPMGQAEKLRARVEARGPSRLRYEVPQADEAPAAGVVHRHQNGRADALSTTARLAGQPKGGVYGARRSPSTASPRAHMASSRATPPDAARADDVTHRALDIDEEPSRMARPTIRALATRLFTAPHSSHPHVVPAAPRISAPLPLKHGQKRKRGRADEADAAAAPPTKRRTFLQPRRTRARRLARNRLGRLPRLDVASNETTLSYPLRARARLPGLQGAPKPAASGGAERRRHGLRLSMLLRRWSPRRRIDSSTASREWPNEQRAAICM